MVNNIKIGFVFLGLLFWAAYPLGITVFLTENPFMGFILGNCCFILAGVIGSTDKTVRLVSYAKPKSRQPTKR